MSTCTYALRVIVLVAICLVLAGCTANSRKKAGDPEENAISQVPNWDAGSTIAQRMENPLGGEYEDLFYGRNWFEETLDLFSNVFPVRAIGVTTNWSHNRRHFKKIRAELRELHKEIDRLMFDLEYDPKEHK